MFKNWTSAFIFFLILPVLFLAEHIDIERAPQDFILELKKIEIEGYPHAFNPSIVRFRGKNLLSFWIVKDLCQGSIDCCAESHVGLVFLDDDFNPTSEPYLLDFGSKISRAQDARLINIKDTLHIIYGDNQDECVSEGGFRIWTAKLEFDGNRFYLFDQQSLNYFDGENPTRREKNWVPFEYRGNLLLSYSLTPHLVFQPFDRTNCCKTVALTQSSIRWRWGDLRGGTPAVKVGDEYLSFFHSSTIFPSSHSNGKNVLHYFIGAYTFSENPPFAITKISSKPIIAKGFYSGKSYDYYWKPICAIFPCGILVDEEFIWISYGRQDHELWVAKMDREKLLRSLKSVHQTDLPSKWKKFQVFKD